jgi:hypothetical protein
MLHPITFSFPEEKIINEIPIKTKLISSLIPGKLDTYIYTNEGDYYNEYRQSLFAITTKKGGWDCMRHYEIIANGCIPYFPNIEQCPPNTLALFPKDLIKEGNILYEKYKNNNMIELDSKDIEICKDHIIKLLTNIKTYLTTKKVAEYILNIVDCSPKKILYLSGSTIEDYLRCLTLHGFKSIFNYDCHDYPMVPHIYKSSSINYSSLYGKGITYTNLLNPHMRNNDLDKTIEEDIYSKKYDIIIYGSYHRGMPYYDIISKIYDTKDIILLCGEDCHGCDYKKWIDIGHHVFVREL